MLAGYLSLGRRTGGAWALDRTFYSLLLKQEVCVLRHVVRDLQSRYSIPSLANLWHACPKWHTERFSWHAGCTADPLFTSFARPMSLYCEQHLFIQVSHELRSLLRESVPYVKIYRYNPRHLRPKLNGYGDNDKRKVWTS